MTFDAALRELVRDLVRDEVLPVIREELRVASARAQGPTGVLEYLTVAQTAEAAQVEEDTVRGWIHEGKLHAARLPNGHYRIRRTDFEAFLTPAGAESQAGPEPEDEARRVMSLAQARMSRKGER